MAKLGLFLCLSLLQFNLGWCANLTFVPPKRPDLARNYPGFRIINGQPASNNQFPYHVAIFSRTGLVSSICGGSIIGDQWILTAAHCINGAQLFTVIMGGHTISGNEDGRIKEDTTEYIVHPEFNANVFYADVGLIHLTNSISFNDRIQPIALTIAEHYIDEKVDMTISGFGVTSHNSGVSNTLNYADLVSITNGECANIYGISLVTQGTLCARGRSTQSPCVGDSGGPLVFKFNGVTTQGGVVSYGFSGCDVDAPTAYTRLSYYRKWIREQTGI